ncbi:hypothetical protein [Edaphobacter sp.]|uniref:hypothetical protein n=1 Tax=Edaphobacter sp. TaxID=1934404 RepID=UPI002DB6D629|nr:hypothetical protein [Edaphobacter sp.]HEU5342559.1 hypothetical protein [Edaphobacter sp.]
MNLQRAVLFLAAAALATFAASTAHAQAAVYGTFTVNQLSGIKNSPAIPPCNPSIVLFCPTYNDSVNLLGGTFGGYYDFLNLGHVKLGVDARGTLSTTTRGAETYANGTGGRLYSGLGGLRAVFHTRWVPIRPYLQASAGVARTDYGINNNSAINLVDNPSGKIGLTTNFQYMGYAGVDITLLPVMDFRLVEFGYGAINPFGTGRHNYPVKSVSSGIVFHLPF